MGIEVWLWGALSAADKLCALEPLVALGVVPKTVVATVLRPVVRKVHFHVVRHAVSD